jgi:hypothetical protein
LKGVISKCDELLIPNVCDKIIFNITDFIKVDFPAAFGPVIRILFFNSISFLTVDELSK